MARRESSVAADPALAQKKRARRRLVGAIVLGIAAVIILPLVLDSEPRQDITDIEISIPSLDDALPAIERPRSGELAVAPTAPSPAAEMVVPPVPEESPGGTSAVDRPPSAASSSAETVTDEPADLPAVRTEARSPASVVKQAGKKPARPTVAAGPDAAPDGDGAGTVPDGTVAPSAAAPAAAAGTGVASRAASREGTAADTAVASAAPTLPAAPAPASAGERFALQIGAYANAGSARAQLDKVRRTGLPAWAETVETSQGRRTRVRVGPFATRAQADQARATLSLAGMESVVVDAR